MQVHFWKNDLCMNKMSPSLMSTETYGTGFGWYVLSYLLTLHTNPFSQSLQYQPWFINVWSANVKPISKVSTLTVCAVCCCGQKYKEGQNNIASNGKVSKKTIPVTKYGLLPYQPCSPPPPPVMSYFRLKIYLQILLSGKDHKSKNSNKISNFCSLILTFFPAQDSCFSDLVSKLS